jgi:hypothetical protein
METESTIQNDAPKRNRFLVGPAEGLVTLGIAAGIFGLWTIQFADLNIFSLTILIVFFLMGIPLQASWAIYLLFVTLIVVKFAFAPLQSIQVTTLGWLDLLFACVAMTFAGLCFRYLELYKYVSTFYPEAGKPGSSDKKTQFQFPSLLGGRWWLIPLAVFVATVLLFAFPHESNTSRRFWITPTGARLIFLTFFLFFFWFVCRSIIALAMRWRMEPEQADVQVRGLIANELWVEQRPIEARRLKLRSRDRET